MGIRRLAKLAPASIALLAIVLYSLSPYAGTAYYAPSTANVQSGGHVHDATDSHVHKLPAEPQSGCCGDRPCCISGGKWLAASSGPAVFGALHFSAAAPGERTGRLLNRRRRSSAHPSRAPPLRT